MSPPATTAPLTLLILFLLLPFLQFAAVASPAGGVVKQLSSVVKWSRAPSHSYSSPKAAPIDASVVQFENGYYVETVVEGEKLGVTPYSVCVLPEGGDLLAVDSTRSNVVRITAPLSEYSRGRLLAGSFQGYSGHVDGKPSDARFKHPKGAAMDDKGNVYVADTANLAIRKISEYGVTTIAGGKSSLSGYRDGPSEDAKFSHDFDLVYVKKSCSLLVIDRGNAALRQIALQREDCDHEADTTMLPSDVILIIGAVLAGYLFYLLQHFIRSRNLYKIQAHEEEQLESSKEKPPLVVETIKEEPSATWPSIGTLLSDLVKFSMEAISNILVKSVSNNLWRAKREKTDLAPLKDRLVMPEDEQEYPLASEKLSGTSARPGPVPAPVAMHEATLKPQKSAKVAKLRDASVSSKHRLSKRPEYPEASKRPEYPEAYSSVEVPQLSSKSQKDRVRYRHRDSSGETAFGSGHLGSKSTDVKSTDFSDHKFAHYNIRSKYTGESSYRY